MKQDAQERHLARLRTRPVPARTLLTSDESKKLSRVAFLCALLPGMVLAAWLSWTVPIDPKAHALEWAERSIFFVFATGWIFLAIDLLTTCVRTLMGLEEGLSAAWRELIQDVMKRADAPSFENMAYLNTKGEEFPGLIEVAGLWATRREDGLLDGTDMRHLCRTARLLSRCKARQEARLRKVEKERLTREAIAQQRAETLRNLNNTGLGAQIEAQRLTQSLEQGTASAPKSGSQALRL